MENLISQRSVHIGIPSKLTALKLQRLTDLQFCFANKTRLTFDQRFDQWLAYRQEHDGKDPPRYSEDGLGKWVTMIRDKRRALDAGKPSNLTAEQVDTLREKYAIYIVRNGRINVAGMTENNMDHLCAAISDVLQSGNDL